MTHAIEIFHASEVLVHGTPSVVSIKEVLPITVLMLGQSNLILRGEDQSLAPASDVPAVGGVAAIVWVTEESTQTLAMGRGAIIVGIPYAVGLLPAVSYRADVLEAYHLEAVVVDQCLEVAIGEAPSGLHAIGAQGVTLVFQAYYVRIQVLAHSPKSLEEQI